MADNLMTFEDVVQNIVPKVTIQRIVLETSATDIPSDPKNPHATPPDIPKAFKDPTYTLGEDSDKLKANLTLSLRGFKTKSLDLNNPLTSIFDNLDLMSMVKTTVYQITSLEHLGKLMIDIDLKVLHGIITHAPQLFPKRELSIQEILQSLEVVDTVEIPGQDPEKIFTKIDNRYENIDSDGSVTYDFPFRLDPYLLEKNTNFLAYLVVTEVDSDSLVDSIKAAIGGSSDYELPTEVEEYVKQYNNNVANKTMSLDIVINNGVVTKTAALLQRQDNQKYWFGPYHEMPNGNLMTGAEHNDTNIAPKNRDIVLIPVLLANTKIVDLRDDEEIEKVLLKEVNQITSQYDQIIKSSSQKKKSDKNTLEEMPEKFSSSYKSAHSDGSCSYLFGVDKIKILKNRSLLSGIAQNIMMLSKGPSGAQKDLFEDVRAEILNATQIKYIKVFRRRIKVADSGINRLGGPTANNKSFTSTYLNADLENSYEDSKFVLVASIEKDLKNQSIEKIDAFNFLESLAKEMRYNFYSFRDYAISALAQGDYEYSYEMSVEDGITKVLTNKLQTLMASQAEVKRYLKFIEENIVICYDEARDQFKSNYIKSNYTNTGPGGSLEALDVPAIIQLATTELTKIILMLNPKTNIGKFVYNMVFLAHPDTGNFQGLLKFIKIVDTFIDKIEKIPGVRTGIKEYLDLGTTSLTSGLTKEPATIKIKETFPDNVDLDNYGTGYEYIIPTTIIAANVNSNSVNSILRIQPETYRNISNGQLQENFLLDNNSPNIGSSNAINVSRYFTPAQVFVNRRRYRTNSMFDLGTQIVSKPYLLNFNYYKPIILDIINYHINRQNNGTDVLTSAKNNVIRLIEIAAKYGISFQDDFVEQLQFLSDPAPTDNSQYSDSSEFQNFQQNSTKNTNLSGVDFEDTDQENPAEEYENVDIEGMTGIAGLNSKYSSIENLMFGMLSNIILQKEDPLSTAYLFGANTPDGVNLISRLPSCLQSLFIQHSTNELSSYKEYLSGQMLTTYKQFGDYPTSLSTIGWWFFNYSNIVEVRYIKEYDNLFNPVWAPLTLDALSDTVGSGKRIICKLFKYENTSLGVINKNLLFDLPVYNEHFIIEPGADMVILPNAPKQSLTLAEEDDSDLKQTANEALNLAASIRAEDLRSFLVTDEKVVKNKNARKLSSEEAVKIGRSTRSARSTARPTSSSPRPVPSETQGRTGTERDSVRNPPRSSNY